MNIVLIERMTNAMKNGRNGKKVRYEYKYYQRKGLFAKYIYKVYILYSCSATHARRNYDRGTKHYTYRKMSRRMVTINKVIMMAIYMILEDVSYRVVQPECSEFTLRILCSLLKLKLSLLSL